MDTQHYGYAPGSTAHELVAHLHDLDLAPSRTLAGNAGGIPIDEKASGTANYEGLKASMYGDQDTHDKRFATLRAQLAFQGHCLHRTSASDGPVQYFVTGGKVVRELRHLADVTQFLEQSRGAHA